MVSGERESTLPLESLKSWLITQHHRKRWERDHTVIQFDNHVRTAVAKCDLSFLISEHRRAFTCDDARAHKARSPVRIACSNRQRKESKSTGMCSAPRDSREHNGITFYHIGVVTRRAAWGGHARASTRRVHGRAGVYARSDRTTDGRAI